MFADHSSFQMRMLSTDGLHLRHEGVETLADGLLTAIHASVLSVPAIDCPCLTDKDFLVLSSPSVVSLAATSSSHSQYPKGFCFWTGDHHDCMTGWKQLEMRWRPSKALFCLESYWWCFCGCVLCSNCSERRWSWCWWTCSKIYKDMVTTDTILTQGILKPRNTRQVISWWWWTCSKIYKDMVTTDTILTQGILKPRNTRQVINMRRNVSAAQRLSKDDVYNLIQLAYHMPETIWKVELYPDLACVVGVKELMDELNVVSLTCCLILNHERCWDTTQPSNREICMYLFLFSGMTCLMRVLSFQ